MHNLTRDIPMTLDELIEQLQKIRSKEEGTTPTNVLGAYKVDPIAMHTIRPPRRIEFT